MTMTTIRRPSYWTPQDDARLAAWTAQKKTDVWMAKQLGRTPHAVECRRKRIGLMRWRHKRKPELLGAKAADPTIEDIERVVNELRAARGCEPVAWPVSD